MVLRIFSVIGEALNFGSRRMGITMRIGWLPVALILLTNMVTIFAYLSVFAGRVITFTEIPTYIDAQQTFAFYAAQAWSANPQMMGLISVINAVLVAVLASTFIAPLIRLSGNGIRPSSGVLKLEFGPDQLRYLFAGVFSFFIVALTILIPLASASVFILQYIIEALGQGVASFPDANSIHTIKVTTLGQELAAESTAWMISLGIPVLATIPFGLLIWAITFRHFDPKNRPAAPEEGSIFLRLIVTFIASAVIIGAGYFLFKTEVVKLINQTALFSGDNMPDLNGAPVNAILILGVSVYLLAGYLNLRLYPYPGVAVCRESLALADTLKVTRGWNLIRLQLILFGVGAFILAMQWFINSHMMSWILSTVALLYQAVSSSSRLVNSGVTGEWITPFFILVWNSIRILINFLWLFFTFGVVAGLYGRLYRESEKDFVANPIPAGDEVWRRHTDDTLDR